MHALLRFRLASFVLFVLFGVLNITFAAWNLTVVGPASTSADIYTIAFSAISLLVVGGMLIMEQVRTGSPTLWVEMTWVGAFALLSLVSAATTTALVPVAACGMAQATTDPQSCASSNAVVASNWLTTIIYLSWFITTVIYGVTRSSYDRNVWFKEIKDVDLRPDNETINEKIAGLPTLHHRQETRTSEYSVSTNKTEKESISIVVPYNYRSGPVGVDAINGAPAYHPYSTTNAWNQRNVEQSRTIAPAPVSSGNLGPSDSPQTVEVPPRRPFFVARPYAMSTGGSSIEQSANAGSNPSSDFEWINTAYKNAASPSPAVIMQVHKVPAQLVLYGAQAAGAEEHRRTRSNTDPTRGGQWFSTPSNEQPNRPNIVLVDDRRPSEGGIGLTPQTPFRKGHTPALSTDSALGVRSKKPKHRPPPLDLSRLSNIKQAERR